VKDKSLKTLVLLALWCGLFAPVNTFGGGWGIERGRADAGDVARLVVDQVSLMRARKQIDGAIQRPLLAGRQGSFSDYPTVLPSAATN
jgi:hypothetical protein